MGQLGEKTVGSHGHLPQLVGRGGSHLQALPTGPVASCVSLPDARGHPWAGLGREGGGPRVNASEVQNHPQPLRNGN